jgi:hypothetical protein
MASPLTRKYFPMVCAILDRRVIVSPTKAAIHPLGDTLRDSEWPINTFAA